MNYKLLLLIAAWTILGLIFGLIAVILFVPIPPENMALVNDVKSNLFIWGTLILGFYWGSSQGSKDKDIGNGTAV